MTVHPVPAPPSTNEEDNNKIKAGGKSQNEILFNRGNAISGAPIINGTNQFSVYSRPFDRRLDYIFKTNCFFYEFKVLLQV